MTDPVNVPLLPCPFCGGEASIERYGNTRVSTQYHCDDCGCFLETGEEFNHGRSWNTRATLTAAPKAEPVQDRVAIIEAVKTAMNDAWCDITSDTGFWPADLHRVSERGPVRIEYRPAIWTETTAEMVANTLAQPEAPKVEQEPVGTVAIIPRKPTDKEISEIRYNINRKRSDGSDLTEHDVREVIDNYFYNVGQPHPAPASDELLEALSDLASWFDKPVQGLLGPVWAIPSGEQGADDAVEAAQNLIAKNKGPQS